MKHFNRVWAEIDLDVFRENLYAIRHNICPKTSIIGVIKTDGYGHGATELAREMEEMDFVSGYAVATVEEALKLRKDGIKKPILILGYTFSGDYADMILKEIRATVFTEQMLQDISDTAMRLGKTMKVHIAVDTGMSRIGIRPDCEGIEFIRKALEMPGIEVEGIFTHFARADEADKSKAFEQLNCYRNFVALAEETLGIRIPVHHCSNSAGIVEIKEANMDAVRAGIILYGLWPSEEVKKDIVLLKPILSLHSKIAYVKELEAGREISYGGTFTTKAPMRVATVPVGYGDGFPRMLSNKGEVLICGKRAKILGRICMDQFMVDVTDILEAQTGTQVTLIGSQGEESITMEEIGERSQRFNYELACCLGKRVPRIYRKGGKVIGIKEDIW
ncbi:MAG: alanine racemase [Lachnospiraceae bacterium]|nr:alanine racemase [Lachnospiraceae bacterium]